MSEEQPVTALSTVEAVDKALLYAFQLSNIDYAAIKNYRAPEAFIRALEQGGFTVSRRETVADLRASLAAEVGKTLTDARIDELMRQAAIPLHGRPVDPLSRHVAAMIRVDVLRLIEGDTDARER